MSSIIISFLMAPIMVCFTILIVFLVKDIMLSGTRLSLRAFILKKAAAPSGITSMLQERTKEE